MASLLYSGNAANRDEERREIIFRLDVARLAIEDEAKSIEEELNASTNGVAPPGISDPLIDNEGFPRADIDLYRTRKHRQRLACLRTDHKELMRKLEKALLDFHESPSAPVNGVIDKDQPSSKPDPSTPFCSIRSILPASPAAQGGLLVDDKILHFGEANASNHRRFEGIAECVRNSVDQVINVVVERDIEGKAKIIEIKLIPRQWEGPGILGCQFVPL